MTDADERPSPRPQRRPEPEKGADREARLSEALRANLRRRKAAARAAQETGAGARGDAPDDS